MDPTACLAEVFSHIADGEYGEARFSLGALTSWRNGGGFLPNFPKLTDPLSDEEFWAVIKTLDLIIETQEELGNGG